MKLKNILLITLTALSFSPSGFGADLNALKSLYQKHYQQHYQPRFCGRNVRGFIQDAHQKRIDLTGAYVLKVEGLGFLETSGFYTRSNPGERTPLGRFHMLLVADGYVFDFDLHKPLVLTVHDYIRLQFMPPYEPYQIFGISYSGTGNPDAWLITRFNWQDYMKGQEITRWKMKLNEWVNLEKIKLD